MSSDTKTKQMGNLRQAETAHLSLKQVVQANFDTSRRKRPAPSPLVGNALSGGLRSCNSDFLSNLLADVAKAKEEIIEQRRADGKDLKLLSTSASSSSRTKRRRTALHKRCDSAKEPSPALDLLWEESWMPPPPCRHNQVHAVPPELEDKKQDLPATVSESFEGMMTKTDQQDLNHLPVEDYSRSEEDSFGWFVDMEGGDEECIHRDSLDPYRSRSWSSSDLAFSAYTAPKASNHDAELEWAKAADTVDDVLGDLL